MSQLDKNISKAASELRFIAETTHTIIMRGILALLILASVCCTTLACSCGKWRLGDKKKYCLADFVMKIKVRRNLKIPGERNADNAFYKIKVKQIWKYPVDAPPLNKRIKLFTASSSALCGVTYLQKGVEYLVTGTIDSHGVLWLFSCDSLTAKLPLPEESPINGWQKNPPKCQLMSSSSSPSSSSSTDAIIYDASSAFF